MASIRKSRKHSTKLHPNDSQSTAYTPENNFQDMINDEDFVTGDGLFDALFDEPDDIFLKDIDAPSKRDGFFNEQNFKKERIKCTDSVSTVNEFRLLQKKHKLNKELQEKYNKKTTEELLYEYHFGKKLDQKTRKWLRDEVFYRTFFLIPHALRQQYSLAGHIFNDAVQNMSYTVLQAIERFDPTKEFTFVNYIVGYFRAAISKTFKDSNIVTIPTNKKKGCNDKTSDTHPTKEEITFYTGVEYTDNSSMGLPNFDFEENMLGKEIKGWLSEALTCKEANITPDERMVIILHYGLFGHKQQPYRKIAKLRAKAGKGCAYSRLSQICTKGVKKLQRYFNNRLLGEK